ncbi:MAG: signal peptidase II [Actinomycetota bacterium]
MSRAGRLSLARLSIVVAAVAVVIDQITKAWAVDHLGDGHVDHVIWTLQFNLAYNNGMAFGRGQGWGPLIGILATIIVVVLLLSLGKQSGRVARWSTGLIIGGAVGNIVDRIFRGDGFMHGSVVDFIDFQWFPIFNVADICVNVGGALMVMGFLLTDRAADSQEPAIEEGSDVV